MMSIHDVYVGMRVRSTQGAIPGEVIETDYSNIKIRWEDGVVSTLPKRDGFVMFVPRDIRDAESAKR